MPFLLNSFRVWFPVLFLRVRFKWGYILNDFEIFFSVKALSGISGAFSEFRFSSSDDLRNVPLRVIFARQPKHIEVAPEMLRFGFSINLDQKAEINKF